MAHVCVRRSLTDSGANTRYAASAVPTVGRPSPAYRTSCCPSSTTWQRRSSGCCGTCLTVASCQSHLPWRTTAPCGAGGTSSATSCHSGPERWNQGYSSSPASFPASFVNPIPCTGWKRYYRDYRLCHPGARWWSRPYGGCKQPTNFAFHDRREPFYTGVEP